MWYCHEVSPSPDPIPPTVLTPRFLSAELKCVHSWHVRCMDDSTRQFPDNHRVCRSQILVVHHATERSSKWQAPHTAYKYPKTDN